MANQKMSVLAANPANEITNPADSDILEVLRSGPVSKFLKLSTLKTWIQSWMGNTTHGHANKSTLDLLSTHLNTPPEDPELYFDGRPIGAGTSFPNYATLLKFEEVAGATPESPPSLLWDKYVVFPQTSTPSITLYKRGLLTAPDAGVTSDLNGRHISVIYWVVTSGNPNLKIGTTEGGSDILFRESLQNGGDYAIVHTDIPLSGGVWMVVDGTGSMYVTLEIISNLYTS